MDATRLGTVCRTLRVRNGWRQSDLALKAGVSRSAISTLELGRVGALRVDAVVRIFGALGGRINFVAQFQGGESLDRLLNARHSTLHESVARSLLSLPWWVLAPEVSFAIQGERGVIDILAWHAATRSLIVIELKTEIVNVSKCWAPWIARSGWPGRSRGSAAGTRRPCRPG